MTLPDWFKIRHIDNTKSRKIDALMARYRLHSVCQSAHCPNRSKCWSQGTATFMVMGDICTRGCRFCAVKTSPKPPPLDPEEPENLAEAVSQLKLIYIVITSVDRDDLDDYGAAHVSRCIEAVKRKSPKTIVEVLIPDFRAEESAIMKVVDARPDVISHNLETVERLTPQVRDRRAGYRQSLDVLRLVRELSEGKIITKSGIMLGFGETGDEVKQAMEDCLAAGAEIFTIGQYLAPSASHFPVKEFVRPERFKEYEGLGYDMGFRYMACGPLVRSSYMAGEPFVKKILKSRV